MKRWVFWNLIFPILAVLVVWQGLYYYVPTTRPFFDSLNPFKGQAYQTVTSGHGYMGLQGDPGCKPLNDGVHIACAKIRYEFSSVAGFGETKYARIQWNAPQEAMRAPTISAYTDKSTESISLDAPNYAKEIPVDATVTYLDISMFDCSQREADATIYDCKLEPQYIGTP